MAQHNEYGRRAEEDACAYLCSLGHTIICRNYRFDKAEIDVISKIDEVLVFTEVKARSTNSMGNPESFISEAQQNRIAKAAKHYLEEHAVDCSVRFDVIAITKNQPLHHISDAFFPID